MNLQTFLSRITDECEKNKVEIIISPLNRVFYEDICCNGFFDSSCATEVTKEHILGKASTPPLTYKGKTRPVLAAAQDGKTELEFLSLLVHEYCHMRQYLENSPYWAPSSDCELLDEWLTGKEFNETALDTIFKNVISVEVDCEQRVLKLIDEFDISIDKSWYAQKANSYLYFYSWVRKNRVWYNKAPYEMGDIVDTMPTTVFDIDHYFNPNIDLSIFEGCR